MIHPNNPQGASLRNLKHAGLAALALAMLWLAGQPGSRGPTVLPVRAVGLSSPQQSETTMSAWMSWMPASVSYRRSQIESAARAEDLPTKLVAVVALVESGGDPDAVSSAGARGLTQIMPATAREIQANTGLPCADQPFDPEVSIRCGASYLATVRKQTGASDLADLGAGYNCGPGCLSSALRQGSALPAEAVRYWHYVDGMTREWSTPQSQTFEAWMAAGGRVLVERARSKLGLSPG